jgi:hypothetical protein
MEDQFIARQCQEFPAWRPLTASTSCRALSMPICIECCYPVPQLYHVLHSTHKPTKPPSPRAPLPNAGSKQPPAPAASAPATLNNGVSRGGGVSKAAGGDVRLTQCPRCKRFADKYVEHDYVVLFIDLVLVKPQVRSPLISSVLNYLDRC